jgi:hypothetical protein
MISSANGAGVPPAGWRTHGIGDLSELAQARVEAGNIAQWLARIANSYVEDDAWERRITLEFRSADAAIVTRQFGKDISLEMHLPTLQLQFLDNGKPVPHIFDPDERSPAEAEAWILVELLHRGIGRESFSKELPYTIPGMMSGDAEDYSPQLCKQGLRRLTSLFQDAAAVLTAAASAETSGDILVAVRPATFDLTTLSKPGSKIGAFGFSPGDAQSSEPYYFTIETNSSNNSVKRLIAKATTLIDEKNVLAAAIKLRKLAP